jgi:hypothetical protein
VSIGTRCSVVHGGRPNGWTVPRTRSTAGRWAAAIVMAVAALIGACGRAEPESEEAKQRAMQSEAAAQMATAVSVAVCPFAHSEVWPHPTDTPTAAPEPSEQGHRALRIVVPVWCRGIDQEAGQTAAGKAVAVARPVGGRWQAESWKGEDFATLSFGSQLWTWMVWPVGLAVAISLLLGFMPFWAWLLLEETFVVGILITVLDCPPLWKGVTVLVSFGAVGFWSWACFHSVWGVVASPLLAAPLCAIVLLSYLRFVRRLRS